MVISVAETCVCSHGHKKPTEICIPVVGVTILSDQPTTWFAKSTQEAKTELYSRVCLASRDWNHIQQFIDHLTHSKCEAPCQSIRLHKFCDDVVACNRARLPIAPFDAEQFKSIQSEYFICLHWINCCRRRRRCRTIVAQWKYHQSIRSSVIWTVNKQLIECDMLFSCWTFFIFSSIRFHCAVFEYETIEFYLIQTWIYAIKQVERMCCLWNGSGSCK